MTVYLTNDLEPSIFRTIAESIEQQNNSPSIVIKLPNILIFSSSGKNLADLEMENFPFLVTGWSEKKSLFPWSLSLTNLSCYYFLNDQVISLLEPITTCVTLAISTKDNDKDSSSIDSTTGLSVYFHIDTTPITANFYKDQVK